MHQFEKLRKGHTTTGSVGSLAVAHTIQDFFPQIPKLTTERFENDRFSIIYLHHTSWAVFMTGVLANGCGFDTRNEPQIASITPIGTVQLVFFLLKALRKPSEKGKLTVKSPPPRAHPPPEGSHPQFFCSQIGDVFRKGGGGRG